MECISENPSTRADVGASSIGQRDVGQDGGRARRGGVWISQWVWVHREWDTSHETTEEASISHLTATGRGVWYTETWWENHWIKEITFLKQKNILTIERDYLSKTKYLNYWKSLTALQDSSLYFVLVAVGPGMSSIILDIIIMVPEIVFKQNKKYFNYWKSLKHCGIPPCVLF